MLDNLIAALSSTDATLERRLTAAMCLAIYDDPRAETALLRVARDARQPTPLCGLSGKALAQIWYRKGRPPPDRVTDLQAPARESIRDFLHRHCPDWLQFLDL